MKATCAILGHSVGELTGHCAAEGMTLSSAVKLAVRSSFLLLSLFAVPFLPFLL